MSEVRVVTARDADVPAIERLAARAPVHGAPPLDWTTTVSALGALVALVDGVVAGAIVLWPHPDHVRVERLLVDPAQRGAGVGSALLDRAELLAIESGVNAVRLLPGGVTPGVRAFALRAGFTGTGGVLERRLA